MEERGEGEKLSVEREGMIMRRGVGGGAFSISIPSEPKIN